MILADVGEDLPVGRVEELQGPPAERLEPLAEGDQPLHPLEERRGVALLRLDVDRLVAVEGVHDRRGVEAGEIGLGEPGVAVAGPLHRGPDAVAVAEVNVVAHADLVAVIEDGRPRQREEEHVEHLDPPPAVADQGGEAAADPEVDPHPGVGGVLVVHVVALLVGHHLERQLVVVPEEERPLAVGRDVGRLPHDLDDRVPVLLADRHEHPRHQGEVERHVTFIPVAEIRQDIGGPLVGLGEEHPVGVVLVHLLAELLEDRVALGQVLAVRPLALDQVGDRVEPHPVDSHVEPEPHDLEDRAEHPGVVEVEVGLMVEEPVPVILLGDGIPRPVRRLTVGEDDPRAFILLRRVAPDVIVPLGRADRGIPRRLEPRVLVRCVIDHQLGDHPDVAAVGLPDEEAEILAGPVAGVDAPIVGDVVTIVAERRGVERQEPEAGHPQILEVVELLHQAREVADPVVVAVEEGLDVDLVDNRIAIPLRVGLDHGGQVPVQGAAVARGDRDAG